MLKLQSIKYSIGNKPLLNDINLTFKKGCLYGVLGPNGSGKTTLLKVITNILKPTKGNIFWDDIPLCTLSVKELSQIISLVPHNPQMQFDYRIKELLYMGLYPTGKREDEGRLMQVLDTVNATHLKDRKVAELSSGEKQRVYIARSLMTDTPVILLDEPTSSLDIKHQIEIWNLIKCLAAQGKIVIVTNHDLNVMQDSCDYFIVLNNGEIASKGKFDQAMDDRIIQNVFGVKKHNQTYQLV